MPNLAMPGDPRYQPKSLQRYFGYDALVAYQIDVELATLRALTSRGVIPPSEYALLTPAVVEALYGITTTEVDAEERVTKHDIRALVNCMKRRMPGPLQRWVHVPLTSYDVIDTARVRMYRAAHTDVVRPLFKKLVASLQAHARRYARMSQIGRTHGQHALPITVGFWLATILNRLIHCAAQADAKAEALCGKISGPVGAYNAQAVLGLCQSSALSFEDEVLSHLGLSAAPISTQIVPPEPLAEYLFSCVLVSAVLGQLGRDCRHLMRTEIGEISEPFAATQTGSSTMAHKRNPITFENEEGMWHSQKWDFGKVFETLVSEHQRDLVGSSVARSLPAIVVRLVYQLERLLAVTAENPTPFIERVVPDPDACARNLALQGDLVLAEPLYIALQMGGYPGDAHHLVNHTVVELAKQYQMSLLDAVRAICRSDVAVAEAWRRVPDELKAVLRQEQPYIGIATERTHQICDAAAAYLGS